MDNHDILQNMLVFRSDLTIPLEYLKRFSIYIPTFKTDIIDAHIGRVESVARYFLYSINSLDSLMITFYKEYSIRGYFIVILERDANIYEYKLDERGVVSGTRELRDHFSFSYPLHREN